LFFIVECLGFYVLFVLVFLGFYFLVFFLVGVFGIVFILFLDIVCVFIFVAFCFLFFSPPHPQPDAFAKGFPNSLATGPKLRIYCRRVDGPGRWRNGPRIKN